MNVRKFLFVALACAGIITIVISNDLASNQCETDRCAIRYILYDVNPYEGFNLRRDVFMRIAILFNQLKRDGVNWKLILPSWNNLPHWYSVDAGSQGHLPWSLFFDLQSLQNYAPVVEMFEFLEDYPNVTLDYVITLQHYQQIWDDNFTWTEKWNIENCQRSTNFILLVLSVLLTSIEITKEHIDNLAENEPSITVFELELRFFVQKYGHSYLSLHRNFRKDTDGLFKGSFSGYEMSAKEVLCMSFQGSASLLRTIIEAFAGKFIAFQHVETLIHDFYGGPEYWQCRAHMKFNKDLISIANAFIKESLVSLSETPSNNSAPLKENPYMCVHLRRRDYLHSHPAQVPSILNAAKQVKEKLRQNKLNIVFLATDAYECEKKKFSDELLPDKVVHYIPPDDVLRTYKDGGVAIIEQIVCSQARYFIGTYESTFSFRIQEERELLKFNPNNTFNRLCGDDEVDCKPPTRWLKTD